MQPIGDGVGIPPGRRSSQLQWATGVLSVSCSQRLALNGGARCLGKGACPSVVREGFQGGDFAASGIGEARRTGWAAWRSLDWAVCGVVAVHLWEFWPRHGKPRQRIVWVCSQFYFKRLPCAKDVVCCKTAFFALPRSIRSRSRDVPMGHFRHLSETVEIVEYVSRANSPLCRMSFYDAVL